MKKVASLLIAASTFLAAQAMAVELKSAVESPDAKAILAKDALPAPTKFTLPKGCVTTDKAAIARGEFIFHNLNGGKAKNPPEGIALKNGDGSPKQFGNCVACHNIEKAQGPGNIGPDLTAYNTFFMASGVRTPEWVYQKVADARIDVPDTHMTINLTNGLMNEQEICEIVSYIIAQK
jgi:sulfur-oxidizing protein SoxX